MHIQRPPLCYKGIVLSPLQCALIAAWSGHSGRGLYGSLQMGKLRHKAAKFKINGQVRMWYALDLPVICYVTLGQYMEEGMDVGDR